MKMLRTLVPLAALFAFGCTDVEHDHDDDHGHGHDGEVITTVVLTFAPQGGGDELVFTWDEHDDGDVHVDDVVLTLGEDYDVSVSFLNEHEDPVEDITEEIADEDDEHQVFFTGSGVEGPATGDNAGAVVEHMYADADAGGLPVGLDNTIATLQAGEGELIVTLRHLPEEDGEAVKVEGLAAEVAEGGFSAIGGDNDAQVTFPIEVQ